MGIIMSSEPTLSPHTAYSASKCLPFGDYSLVATYSKIQTISENVSYSLQAADLLIYEASTNSHLESEELFTFGASETSLCEIQLVSDTDCSNCTWVTLELTLDNYPDETSWNLATEVGKHDVDVLSGNPYLVHSLTYGRQNGRKKKNSRKKKNGRKKK